MIIDWTYGAIQQINGYGPVWNWSGAEGAREPEDSQGTFTAHYRSDTWTARRRREIWTSPPRIDTQTR